MEQIEFRVSLDLTKERLELLETITDFNIEARYSDEKFSFKKRCAKGMLINVSDAEGETAVVFKKDKRLHRVKEKNQVFDGGIRNGFSRKNRKEIYLYRLCNMA